ncbi:hypothetical protein GG804_02060 [Sphingomonas histidinilytica]|nr:sigma factor-like helix-turn-helix DNA-binding protein [Sphingobium sp. TKS]AMK23235.1 RNA polymerase ECF-type sigma factor [Sphingobium sp. TKS]MBO9375540.1 hypothetical protein [Rhizorhabdus histidinilytica]MCF8709089.1 sigma-70 region 4 domain-containing protein [Rhizorhapis sp. SPR117]
MSDRDSMVLLLEALAFLNDHPNFSLRRDRRRTSYDLAARIDRYLARRAGPTHPAIPEARDRWASTSFLRIDPDEYLVEPAEFGYWVRGWILIGRTSLGEADPELRARYEAAVAALPDITRQAFIAHRVEGLEYGPIAERLGISAIDVQVRIAEALIAIAKAVEIP